MPTVTIDINYPTITEAKEMDFPPESPSLRSISLPFHVFFSVQFDKYLLVAYCIHAFFILFVCLFAAAGCKYRDESQFLSSRNPKSIEIHK